MSLRVRMLRETEGFLEAELNRDTIPCPPPFVDECEEALYIDDVVDKLPDLYFPKVG